jgi:hypothetical protein
MNSRNSAGQIFIFYIGKAVFSYHPNKISLIGKLRNRIGKAQTSGEQCLFIDDREKNTKAAAECGFQTLHLENVIDLERELTARGII